MKFRILSLDGGGTWALIQARVLQDLYGANAAGHDVLGNFDLVVANSGGSIVAAGLAENLRLDVILDMFKSKAVRDRLFVPLPWYKKLNPIGWFVPSPRFSAAAKLAGLKSLLPTGSTLSMKDLHIPGYRGNDVQFAVTAYDYDRDRGKFFRSNVASRAASVANPALTAPFAEAAHASSNAPVGYFDEPALAAGLRFWDGAVAGFNNPVVVGAIEALANGIPAAEICMLSIGTGNTFLPRQAPGIPGYLAKPDCEPSIGEDIKKMAGAVLADPPDTHSFIAYLMLGLALPGSAAQCPLPSPTLVRMNPLIQPRRDAQGAWRLPAGLNRDQFVRLVELDLAATEDEDVTLISDFCDLWFSGEVANQPIRANGELACEIGYSSYGAAKQAWQNCI